VIRTRVFKLVKYIVVPGLICCLLIFIAVDQWSRYRFGASLHQMAGRHLPRQIAWQKEQRPSLTPLLVIIENLIPADDRYNFGLIDSTFTPLWSEDWSTDLVGPSTSYYSALVKHDLLGRPAPSLRQELLKKPYVTSTREITVNSTEGFKKALKRARSGDTITLAPGNYYFKGRSLYLKGAGKKLAPIRIRAQRLGEARLQFELVEGFHVVSPYWIFENLEIEGVCKKISRCEHAFHISRKGKNVSLRNLFVKNFNSHIKVNGSRKGDYPDGGLIEYSMFINDVPRQTGKPVTPIDIVAVNDWIVRKSVIADFAKAGGDRISYAGFYKGAGQNNLFEQNLVLCELRHRGGVRVGLSFGGGGTSVNGSRGKSNRVEHFGGEMLRNVIANCPLDVGVYLNKSRNTLIAENLLIDNTGIHVRFNETDAMIVGNLISGDIIDRNGGRHESVNNSSGSLERFVYPHSFQDQSIRRILAGDLANDRVKRHSDKTTY